MSWKQKSEPTPVVPACASCGDEGAPLPSGLGWVACAACGASRIATLDEPRMAELEQRRRFKAEGRHVDSGRFARRQSSVLLHFATVLRDADIEAGS
jgi:hypothetical protein